MYVNLKDKESWGKHSNTHMNINPFEFEPLYKNVENSKICSELQRVVMCGRMRCSGMQCVAVCVAMCLEVCCDIYISIYTESDQS